MGTVLFSSSQSSLFLTWSTYITAHHLLNVHTNRPVSMYPYRYSKRRWWLADSGGTSIMSDEHSFGFGTINYTHDYWCTRSTVKYQLLLFTYSLYQLYYWVVDSTVWRYECSILSWRVISEAPVPLSVLYGYSRHLDSRNCDRPSSVFIIDPL